MCLMYLSTCFKGKYFSQLELYYTVIQPYSASSSSVCWYLATFDNSHSGPSAVKSCFEKGTTKEDDNMINSIMIIRISHSTSC